MQFLGYDLPCREANFTAILQEVQLASSQHWFSKWLDAKQVSPVLAGASVYRDTIMPLVLDYFNFSHSPIRGLHNDINIQYSWIRTQNIGLLMDYLLPSREYIVESVSNGITMHGKWS